MWECLMVRECSIHNHNDYPVIERQLTLGMISPAKAGQALGVSTDMIDYHRKHCATKSELVLDDMRGFDPYKKLLNIAQQLFVKAEEMLESGDLQHGSEKLTSIVTAATNAITKLHSMGRTFVPVSEKKLQAIQDEFNEIETWLASGLCQECRVAFDKYLSRGEEHGEELELSGNQTEDSESE